MKVFCATCKQHIDIPEGEQKPGENRLRSFLASGHDTNKVRRLQRDPGRKQRPREWVSAA